MFQMPKARRSAAKPVRRLFLLGAGFSAAVKMPVSRQLPQVLANDIDSLGNRISMDDWCKRAATVFELKDPNQVDVEMLFETMYLERELRAMWATYDALDFRHLRHHESVETIGTAIGVAYDRLVELLRTEGERVSLTPLMPWARAIRKKDLIVTLNYDLVAERLLTAAARPHSSGVRPPRDGRIRLLKLHGSVDWIPVRQGRQLPRGCSVLFDPFKDINRGRGPANPPSDEDLSNPKYFRIVRCPSFAVAKALIRDALPPYFNFNLVGFSRIKEPSQYIGFGPMWQAASFGLYSCDEIIVIGFALSRFDGQIRHFIADAMRARRADGKPEPRLRIVDPSFGTIRKAYKHVFGVTPEKLGGYAQSVDWKNI
jgi:hypothetical protein